MFGLTLATQIPITKTTMMRLSLPLAVRNKLARRDSSKLNKHVSTVTSTYIHYQKIWAAQSSLRSHRREVCRRRIYGVSREVIITTLTCDQPVHLCTLYKASTLVKDQHIHPKKSYFETKRIFFFFEPRMLLKPLAPRKSKS